MNQPALWGPYEMTLLELVIMAHRCRSTHHFIAMDALQILQSSDGEDWKNLILKHHTSLLKGAKAPDKDFKDFQNHVLHVQEGEWGGARNAAMEWYGKAVEALRREKWSDAIYALGVMTHYYADPIQPFHTGQTEEEGTMHRALEWSIAKSRDTIKAMIDARGYPRVEGGRETGFVADMVLAGAKYSNPYYQTFIDHYDLDRGVVDPQSGLDQTLLDILADLISYATAGVANLFDRAFEEAAVSPPQVDLDMAGYFAALDIPIRRLTKRISDRHDRKTVEEMYDEYLETGKVIKTLPDDDAAIRKQHAKQVLRVSLDELDARPIAPIGTKHIPLVQHPRPVQYITKTVAIPADRDTRATFAPSSAFRNDAPQTTPETTPDPQVEAPIVMAAAAVEITPDPVIETPTLVETIAEPDIEIVSIPKPEPVAVAETDTSADDARETAINALMANMPDNDDEPEIEADVEVKTETAKPAAAPEPPKPDPKPKAELGPRLTLMSPVVDAPSIGPKTAGRLKDVDITTIVDLLNADAAETSAALNVRYITAKTLTDWQDQTRLMLEAPGLRVLDSQILVGAGIRSAEELAGSSARKVLNAALTFLETPSGARVAWGADTKVKEDDVKQWIDLAKSASV